MPACSRHTHRGQRTTFESQFFHTVRVPGIKLSLPAEPPYPVPFLFVFAFCFFFSETGVSSYSSRYLGTNSSVQAGLELGVMSCLSLWKRLTGLYHHARQNDAPFLLFFFFSIIWFSVTGSYYVALVAPELTSKPGWPRTPRDLFASSS